MEIIKVKIIELNPSEYNPRAMTVDEYRQLEKSLEKFGMVEPIVCNKAEGRKNIIIGGHQRYYLLKNKGFEDVPVVYVDLPNIEDEKELNLRLNANVGHWDWKKVLEEYQKEMLLGVGFSEKELREQFARLTDGVETDGEVPFSEELLLEHNYVVLYFDNAMDWQVAIDKLGLKEVKDLIPRKAQPSGIGRVIHGKEVIDKIG